MLQLVYVSTATRLLTEKQLMDLLEVCRRNNEQLGITGMLLHSAGTYIQLLKAKVTRSSSCSPRSSATRATWIPGSCWSLRAASASLVGGQWAFATSRRGCSAICPGLACFLKRPSGQNRSSASARRPWRCSTRFARWHDPTPHTGPRGRRGVGIARPLTRQP